MADNHESYGLGIKVDFNQLEQATKASNSLYEALKRVDSRFSGMHVANGIPREINHISTVTASYIQRLESEGKTYQANQQKIKAYQGAISELTRKQENLEGELSKIAKASGESSNAFKNQQVRINQTATEINRFKQSINGLDESMKRANPTFLDRIKSKLGETTQSAEKTHSVFKSVFSANVLSNAVSNGFSYIKGSLGGMIRSAHEYNVQQQTMNATWLTLTGNASKGKAMVEQIDNMAAAAQNDTKMVDTLSQKFYAINKSPEQTAKITKSVLTLQDAFGQTDDAVENFGTQFSQMMANQKVSAQDMMSFVNTFPEYREQLLKTVEAQTHTKMSMKQMNKMMSDGKISSKIAITALEDMAHRYRSATDNFTKTIPGMIRTVKSQMPRLVSAFDEPFTKIENPIIKQVSDWATSEDTKKAFGKLGSVVSKGMNKVMSHAFGVGEKNPKPLTNAKRASMDKFLAQNAYSGILPKNQLQKTLNALPKSERSRISKLSRKLPHARGIASTKASGNLPWQNPLAKGNSQLGAGSKAYTKNLSKQLSYYHGLTEAEKKYSAQHQKSITLTDVLNNAIDKFNGTLQKVFDYMSKHGKDFKDIGKDLFSITGTIAKDTWKSFAGIAVNIGKSFGLIGKNADKNGGTIHALAEGLNNLAKNKTALKAISDVIVTMATVKGLKAVSTPFIDIGTKGVHSVQAIHGFAKGLKGIASEEEIGNLSKVGKKFYGWGDSLKTSTGNLKKFFSGLKDSKLVTKIKGWDLGGKASKLGKNFATKFGNGWNKTKVFGSKSKQAFKTFTKYAKDGAKTAGKTFVDKFKQQASLAGKGFKAIGRGLVKGAKGIAGQAKSAGRFLADETVKGYKLSISKLKDLKASGGTLGGTAAKVTGVVGTGLVAGGQVLNAVKDRHSADKRSQDIGGAVGAVAGGALTSMIPVVGPLLAPVGAEVGKYAGRWGGQAVNHFTKGWQRNKPPKKFWSLENLGWSTKDTFQKVGKWGGKVAKGFGQGFKRGKSFVKKNGKELALTGISPMLGIPALLYKNNPKFRKAANSTFRNVKHGWDGAKSWASKLGRDTSRNVKHGWNGMKSWSSARLKDVQSGWQGAASWFGKLGSDMVKNLKSAFSGIGSWFGDLWGKITGGIGKFVGGVKKFAEKHGAGTAKQRQEFNRKANPFLSHALGGSMHTTHHALVGEAGPELAYKPNGSHARLLGAHGPQITKVRSGEHILNARDTHKVLNGGLGNGLILKGYATGNTKLSQTSKSVTGDYKKIADKSSKSLTALSRKSNSTWRKITSQTNKQTDKTRKNSINDYTSMRKGIHKQMDTLHDGVIDLADSTSKGFGKALDKMQKFAKSAMQDTINQLNQGIKGIDRVLSQFGGNASVIKPIKFATGTNGRLAHNTLAMVNDAQEGPRQEAIVKHTGDIWLPKHQNQILPLEKGDAVLNGRQTQSLAKSWGLKHFAKGSGVSHSALRKLAEKNGANPAKSFHDMYTINVKVHQPDIESGMTTLAKNASAKLGNAWSNAMWAVINNAIGGGGKTGPASGLLKSVEKYGEGKHYVWGATGPSTFDCSGLVMYALDKDYGIHYPHFSGAQYAQTQHISKGQARMGDLVFWGPGHHVGVYAGGNKYFSAQSPSQGIHMNTLSSVVGEGSPMFGRVKGLKQDSKSSSKKTKPADNRLMALAKRELGSTALKWIKDKLSDDVGSMGNPAGDGVGRWRKVIKKAASAMHVSLDSGDMNHILTVIQHESGGNPKVANNWDSNAKAGTPSKGLIQFIDPTFQHYAMKGHRNILNGYDQLLAMFNDSTWRRDLTLGGWGPTGSRRYAKGGNPPVGTPVLVGENGPELAQFNSPVHIYDHDQTKQKLSRPVRARSAQPTINININGPISSKKDADMVAKEIKIEIKRALADFAYNIGAEFGGDPSNY